MIKNYFKVTFRNLTRNKGYTFINILGLSIGMAAAMLIGLWIQNELSIERFHEKGDRIYVMYNRDKMPDGEMWAWSTTPKILGPTLQSDYAEVEAFSRHNSSNFLFTVDDKKLKADGSFVDSAFLDMFSFPLIKGNPKQALSEAYNIVLTEDFAKTLFGNEEAMGKTVLIDSIHHFTVTGILRNLPNNTLFSFKYLIPWKYMDVLDWNDTSWGNNSVRTYTLLKEGSSQKAFDDKIRTIKMEHTKDASMPSTHEVFTQLLNRYYLYGKSENGKLVAGNLVTVRMFTILACFILLIACINFMNLSTARSEKRAKEVGIRKVVGVRRQGLIMQFLGESVLLSFISFFIALGIVALSLPGFSQLVRKELYIPIQEPLFWLSCLGFVLFTGTLAGSYPAFYLSSFNPVKVLKGTFKKVNAALTPRKVLVTIQFTFAIILIISTIVISDQIRYGLEREVGYDRDQLIFVPNEGNLGKHYDAIKHDLLSRGAVTSMSTNNSPITQRWSDSWGFQWEGSTEADERTGFLRLGSDADFIKTMGLELVGGRDIDIKRFPTDSSAMLINEAAVKAMRLDDPIGKRVNWKGSTDYMHIVGVIKDFIVESPFQSKIEPLMVNGPGGYWPSTVHFRLNAASSTRANLDQIEQVLKKYNPDYPFEYNFADEDYALKFSRFERTYKLVILFAGLTIFISCLGLFGLATYMAESRTKEIGVRKVLGASVFNIARLLSKEFLLLVFVAFIIASPIAWYFMHKWLEDYSYRISVEWWIFVLTGVISAVITVVTVSFQSIKAAMANPVDSLRDE